MREGKQRVIVFIAGLFSVILLLEIGLRIISKVNQLRDGTYRKSTVSSGEAQYTILCLGNSYTEGTGAPPGESYPDHLQRMMDKSFPDKKIKVINAGRGSLNSSEMLETLKVTIDSTRPDLIILMTGSPNLFTYYKYNDYLERENPETHSRLKKSLFILNDALYKTRVYRLCLFLGNNLRNKINYQKNIKKISKAVYRNLEEYKNAARWIDLTWDWYVINRQENRKLFIEKQNLREIAAWFKRGIEAEPGYFLNYRYLGDIYFLEDNYKEAAKCYIKGIKAGPDNNINENYLRLRKIRWQVNDEAAQKEINEFLNELRKVNPESLRLLDVPGDDRYRFENEYEQAKILVEKLWLENKKDTPDKKLWGSTAVKKAITCFKKGIELEPDYTPNYRYLGDIYFVEGNYLEAAKYYIEGLKANPSWRGVGGENKGYAKLRGLYLKTSDREVQKMIESFIDEFKELTPELSMSAISLKMEDITRWVKADLKEIIRIIRDKNIKLILHNYPPRPEREGGKEIHLINEALKDTAAESGLPFIDDEKLFQDMWDRGENRLDYHENFKGVAGSHLNSRGYKIMAEALYDKIIEEGFLEFDKGK